MLQQDLPPIKNENNKNKMCFKGCQVRTLALLMLSLAAAAFTLDGLVTGEMLALLLVDGEPKIFLELGEIGVGLLMDSVLSPFVDTFDMFNTKLFLASEL